MDRPSRKLAFEAVRFYLIVLIFPPITPVADRLFQILRQLIFTKGIVNSPAQTHEFQIRQNPQAFLL